MARRACTSLPFHDGSVEEEKGPTFFKIIRPGKHLRIPSGFQKHVLHELTERATLKLKNSSDTSWTVKVSKTGKNIYFKDGWQEFLRDNSLGDSDFLVFRYDKNMHFVINIFRKNCVERVNIADLRTREALTFPDNTKRPLARPPTGDHRCDFAVEASHVLKSKAAAASKSKFHYFAKVLGGSKVVYCVERVNIADLRTSEASTFLDNTKRPLAIPPTGDHRFHFAAEAAHVLKSKGNHLPSYAAAAAFKSNFPYFAKVLGVGALKVVEMPTDFYRYVFSSKYDELFLVTSKGKYRVKFRSIRNIVLLSRGWSSFRIANQLEADDICIFELVNENTMVVHIFRN